MLGKLNSKEVEEKWMAQWEKEKIYEFKKDKRPVYSIDSPPPFTSGDLHMGHVLSYSYFDFVARYKRMNGFDVYYPQGWDCQGFPTEVKVEKKHGKNIPRCDFLGCCHDWTEGYIERMRSQMKRMGFSPDWNYEYKTMSPEYCKRVQYSLLKMYEEKQLYLQEHPVFWCPRCESAIAKAETDELQRHTNLNYLKFYLIKEGGKEKGKEEELLIATTRPELLHACVAVFFHPEDERYNKLKEAKVRTPFGKLVPFLPDSEVDREFGTGVVMMCTFGDKQDILWTYRHNLPIIKSMDFRGRLTNAGEFDGLKLEEAKKKVIETLKEKGFLAKQEPLQQIVKIHDRCNTPIEFVMSKEWFANLKDWKKEIVKNAEKMRWVPDFTIVYLKDWAEGLEWDWVISRDRIFGTPIPFWFCDECNEVIPAKIEELPVNPTEIEKTCPKCKKKARGEHKVCDCWVDSSITPLSILNWPWDGELGEEKKPEWKKLFPVSLRPQGTEIIRTWAFYTIYRSAVLTGREPFRELLLNGNVLAPDGKKMSKSLGNIIAPDDLISKYSADAIRQWSALSGALAKDRPFINKDIQFAQSFLNKLWNSAVFVEMNLGDWDGKEPNEKDLRVVDKWILSKLNKLIKLATAAYDEFDFHKAISAIHEFYWHEFCDFYMEEVKHRLYGEDKESKERRSAQYAIRKVLIDSIKMLAPVVSFHTEEIYRSITGKQESIHLSEWPKIKMEFENFKKEEEKGELLKQVLGEVRKYKTANKLSMKDEVGKAIIYLKEKDALEGMEDEMRNTAKVKEVEIRNGEFRVEIPK